MTGFPVFPQGAVSSVARFLTRDLWNEYHDKKDKHGFSFKQLIFASCQNPTSDVILHAGTHDTYHAFEKFFNKVI